MDPRSQLPGESQLKAVASLPPHVESLQHEQQLEQRGMLLNLDLEAALGGLKAGTVTPKQAAGVMHGLIRVEVDVKIAELRQEFSYETMQIAVPAAPAALEHPPLKIYLSEAPTNWHSMVLFFLTSHAEEDANMRRRAPQMFLVSCVMVIFQCLTIQGLYAGTTGQATCFKTDQCRQNMYCFVWNAEGGRCDFCTPDGPLQMQTDAATGATFNLPTDPNFVGFNATAVSEMCSSPNTALANDLLRPIHRMSDKSFIPALVASWCDACLSSSTGAVNELTLESLGKENVAAMAGLDNVALIFGGAMVTMYVVAELRAIELVEIGLQHATGLNWRWRAALTIVNETRKWVFLPTLLAAVSSLVVFQGGASRQSIRAAVLGERATDDLSRMPSLSGDALSVCMNCLAICPPRASVHQ
jgi:hypothetical protein